jgi:hypothetical protein
MKGSMVNEVVGLKPRKPTPAADREQLRVGQAAKICSWSFVVLGSHLL